MVSVRWIVCALIVGFAAASLVFGPRVEAQSAMATWFGCTSITNCSGSSNIPVLVDTSGRIQVVSQ